MGGCTLHGVMALRGDMPPVSGFAPISYRDGTRSALPWFRVRVLGHLLRF